MSETMKGYYALRRDVMALADDLNVQRQKMLETIRAQNEGITKLVEYADKLFPKALNELGSNGELKKEYRTHNPSPEDIAASTNPKQRRCSNCEQLGHTMRTCTNVRAEKPEPEAKPEKKKRNVSPERRAQLAEQLKKARAARGK